MLDGGVFRIPPRIDDEDCKTGGDDQNTQDRRLHGRKYDFMFFALNPTRGGLCSSRRSRNGFPLSRASILCHSAYSITYRRFWKRRRKPIFTVKTQGKCAGKNAYSFSTSASERPVIRIIKSSLQFACFISFAVSSAF